MSISSNTGDSPVNNTEDDNYPQAHEYAEEASLSQTEGGDDEEDNAAALISDAIANIAAGISVEDNESGAEDEADEGEEKEKLKGNEKAEEKEEEEEEEEEEHLGVIDNLVSNIFSGIQNEVLEGEDEGKHGKDEKELNKAKVEQSEEDFEEPEVQVEHQVEQNETNEFGDGILDLNSAIAQMVHDTVNQLGTDYSEDHPATQPPEAKEVSNEEPASQLEPQAAINDVLKIQDESKDSSKEDSSLAAVNELMSAATSQISAAASALNPSTTANQDSGKTAAFSNADQAISDIVNSVVAQANSVSEGKDQESKNDVAEAAIAQIVQNVFQQLPVTDSGTSSKIEPAKPSEDNFQLAMSEMIQNVADELVPEDEGFEDQSQSDMQVALEEIAKNVVEENYSGDFRLNTGVSRQAKTTEKVATKPTDPVKTPFSINDLATSQSIESFLSKYKKNSTGTTETYQDFFDSTNLASLGKSNSVINNILSQKGGLATYWQNKLLNGEATAAASTTDKSTTIPPASSIGKAISFALETILASRKPKRIDNKEKTRLENRERKKRWREKNNARNKDNDLRFRVSKRAALMFGEGDSEEKTKWMKEEFDRRKTKRLRRTELANQDDNLVYGSGASRAGSESAIKFKSSSGSDQELNDSLLPLTENPGALSTLIGNALNAANINMPHEQFTSAVASYIKNYLTPEDKISGEASLKSVGKSNTDSTQTIAAPPATTPDADLTNLIKSGAPSGDAYSKTYHNVKSLSSNAINKDLSKILSNISLLPVKRKSEDSEDSDTKRPDIITKNEENLQKKIPTKPLPSFKLPVYKKPTTGPNALASIRPGLSLLNRKSEVVKKPSILSSVSLRLNSQTNIRDATKSRLAPGVFRRPLYRSTASNV